MSTPINWRDRTSTYGKHYFKDCTSWLRMRKTLGFVGSHWPAVCENETSLIALSLGEGKILFEIWEPACRPTKEASNTSFHSIVFYRLSVLQRPFKKGSCVWLILTDINVLLSVLLAMVHAFPVHILHLQAGKGFCRLRVWPSSTGLIVHLAFQWNDHVDTAMRPGKVHSHRLGWWTSSLDLRYWNIMWMCILCIYILGSILSM